MHEYIYICICTYMYYLVNGYGPIIIYLITDNNRIMTYIFEPIV